MRADWSCVHTASGDTPPSPPRGQQVIDGYQLDLLVQAVPIRAAGLTSAAPRVRHQREMKGHRKPPEQTPGSLEDGVVAPQMVEAA